MSDKPREFWVIERENKSVYLMEQEPTDGHEKYSHKSYHVIEKSAADRLAKALKEVNSIQYADDSFSAERLVEMVINWSEQALAAYRGEKK